MSEKLLKPRTYKLDDATYNTAFQKALSDGTNLATVVSDFVRKYAKKEGKTGRKKQIF